MDKKIFDSNYFTLSQLSLFTKNKKNALVYVSRWLKNKTIIKIRNWIYISSKKFLEFSLKWESSWYLEFMATNLVYAPSYLSLEYILYENNVLSENVYNFTLVTTKKTAKFKNNFWNFIYKSIKKDYFDDYELIKKWKFIIYKATVEKALFDYFYFKRWIIWDQDYFEELRLNLENIEFRKFKKIVKKINNKKLLKVLKFLELIK
jgi:hypothetical protein